MLTGIKIIDFTNYLPGPFATMRLKYLGAEVIKIEAPTGDPARQLEPKIDGQGAIFKGNNRGKHSLFLDLKNEHDVMEVNALILEADVVIESFRPGVMKRLTLDYPSIKQKHPGIIYCSLVGYGENTTYSTLGSHDLNYMALSGMLSQWKDDHGRPIHPSQQVADLVGGIVASERILAALVQKGITGEGSYHQVSMVDAMTALMGNHLLVHQAMETKQGIEVLAGSVVNYSIYETSDHRYMALGALEKKFWEQFCYAVNHREWVKHHMAQKKDPIYTHVCQLFQERTFQEWSNFSEQVDCCLTPVLEVDEIGKNHYHVQRGTIAYEKGWQHIRQYSDLRSVNEIN